MGGGVRPRQWPCMGYAEYRVLRQTLDELITLKGHRRPHSLDKAGWLGFLRCPCRCLRLGGSRFGDESLAHTAQTFQDRSLFPVAHAVAPALRNPAPSGAHCERFPPTHAHLRAPWPPTVRRSSVPTSGATSPARLQGTPSFRRRSPPHRGEKFPGELSRSPLRGGLAATIDPRRPPCAGDYTHASHLGPTAAVIWHAAKPFCTHRQRARPAMVMGDAPFTAKAKASEAPAAHFKRSTRHVDAPTLIWPFTPATTFPFFRTGRPREGVAGNASWARLWSGPCLLRGDL